MCVSNCRNTFKRGQSSSHVFRVCWLVLLLHTFDQLTPSSCVRICGTTRIKQWVRSKSLHTRILVWRPQRRSVVWTKQIIENPKNANSSSCDIHLQRFKIFHICVCVCLCECVYAIHVCMCAYGHLFVTRIVTKLSFSLIISVHCSVVCIGWMTSSRPKATIDNYECEQSHPSPVHFTLHT